MHVVAHGREHHAPLAMVMRPGGNRFGAHVPEGQAVDVFGLQKDMRGVIDLIDANKVNEAYTKLAALMKKWEDDAKKGGD